MILQKLCKNKAKAFVCSDFNVNYIENSYKKAKLDDILGSFNLRTIIPFPTRIGSNSFSIIDNIFIDEHQFSNYEVISVSNELSDHEVQLLNAHLQVSVAKKKNEILIKRNINDYNIAEFKMKLCQENCKSVISNSDINILALISS
jgi:hypothetical protein